MVGVFGPPTEDCQPPEVNTCPKCETFSYQNMYATGCVSDCYDSDDSDYRYASDDSDGSDDRDGSADYIC